VAVEKLASGKFAENAMRQDALQTIFSGRLDIFYPRICADFLKSEFFNSHRRLHHLGIAGEMAMVGLHYFSC